MDKTTDSRRVRMTKKILKDALLELMEDKHISRISIKEICELADVNRSTFYAHYDSQFALLDEIEKGIVDATPRINLYTDAPIQGELRKFFEYLEDNKRVCRILFKSSSPKQLEIAILDKIFGKTEEKPQWITGLDLHNPVHVKMLMSAFGGLAMAERWIAGEFNCSADELADAISGYIQHA